jgi:hypothetical protein
MLLIGLPGRVWPFEGVEGIRVSIVLPALLHQFIGASEERYGEIQA